MRFLVLAHVLLGVFFAGERLLREGDEARSLQPTPSDRGSTRLIVLSYGAALNAGWVAPLLSVAGGVESLIPACQPSG